MRWHAQGERETNYFYGLEKRNYNNKTVTRLKISEDKFTSNQFETLEKERLFYKSLYKSRNLYLEIFKDSVFFNQEIYLLYLTSCEGTITITLQRTF